MNALIMVLLVIIFSIIALWDFLRMRRKAHNNIEARLDNIQKFMDWHEEESKTWEPNQNLQPWERATEWVKRYREWGLRKNDK